MYESRTWDDRLVPVTGLIVAPKETGSAPRPILNWAQGTTGGARVCAPSLDDNPAQNLVQRSDTAPIDYGVPYLTDFLARGFVVVASDYYGLGGPGVHQFLVGTTAARNGLDIARAARSMKDLNAGVDLLTFGWSQGGGRQRFLRERSSRVTPPNLHTVAWSPSPLELRFPILWRFRTFMFSRERSIRPTALRLTASPKMAKRSSRLPTRPASPASSGNRPS